MKKMEKLPLKNQFKNLKNQSGCSLKIERANLPCINETRTKKFTREPNDKTNCIDSLSGNRWLKPGISLPKMREKTLKPVLSPQQSSSSDGTSESSGSLKDVPVAVIAATASNTRFGGCFFNSKEVTEELIENHVGPSLCLPSFEVAVIEVNDDSSYTDDTVKEESKALKNWEEWMKTRRRQNDYFSEKMKRDRCKLVMNTADDIRQVMQEKSILTYACLGEPDKWRGNLDFWKKPCTLARKGMKNKYCALDTLAERGIAPPVELVFVPEAMRMEKDVFCDERLRKNWENLKYRQMQEKKNAKQIKKIVPHKIDARDLLIIGEKIKSNNEFEYIVEKEVPIIEITPPPEAQATPNDSMVFLVINGVELKLEEMENREIHTWSLTFEESPTGTITEKALFVENKGTVAVRYAWSCRNIGNELKSLPKGKISKFQSFFYFNKNPGFFLQGQKTEIKFYHHSKIPGYHSEEWYLKLYPRLFEIGKVRLTALAESNSTIKDFLKIDAYLDSCLANTIAVQMIDEIFERAKPEVPKSIEYQSLFMEEELFEFQNPDHYYRYDIVGELKALFKEIPLNPPIEWDLNLFTLEDLIRTFVPGQVRHSLLCKLMELTRILLRPRSDCYKSNNKHKMLYNALCSIIDSTETNMKFIKDNFTRIGILQSGSEQESDDEFSIPVSLKSGKTPYYEGAFSVVSEDESSVDNSSSEKSLSWISCKNMIHYHFALNVMFFKCLCEAAEVAAGVIESCKLFEHHGEIVTPEINNFLFSEPY